MRKHIKENIVSLCTSMSDLHNQIAKTIDIKQRMEFLQICQQAAISIGETVEQYSKENLATVNLLEDYCDEIYSLSQIEFISKKSLTKLKKIHFTIANDLRKLKITYQVLFLPYQAAMWDSLESIWLSCQQDNRCECYVIPIPYYKFDSAKNIWELSYEGGKFPNYVPITDFATFDLEQNCPDIAYIHNPYDDGNRVTRIEPKFFSRNLKKHVNTLVYVPYFVNSGFVSDGQLYCPAYAHVDYIIGQSEEHKQAFNKLPYYNKVLPLGSPKFDRLINMIRDGVELPDDWQDMLKNKHKVLLNTSISSLLTYGELVIKKLKYVFESIQKNENIILIWRPHPLLEATFKSMRQELWQEYLALKNYFIENNIGILDTTSDITKTIAICDAYIGDMNSSITTLFMVSGKPIFCFDYFHTRNISEQQKNCIGFTKLIKSHDSYWLTGHQFNALFKVDANFSQLEYVGSVTEERKLGACYVNGTAHKQNIYLSPYYSVVPAKYDIGCNSFEPIGESKEAYYYCSFVDSYQDTIIFMPSRNKCITMYDTITHKWSYHYQAIEELRKEGIYPNARPDISGYTITDGKLWLCSRGANRLLEFDIVSGDFNIAAIGKDNYGYSDLIIDGNIMMLAETHSGNIVCWDMKTNDIAQIDMPNQFTKWASYSLSDRQGTWLTHKQIINFDKYVITIPSFANTMVKIEKETGHSTLFCYDFIEDMFREDTDFARTLFQNSRGLISLAEKIDDQHLLLQRAYDHKFALININSETYKEFYLPTSETDINSMLGLEKGFCKETLGARFLQQENSILRLDRFLHDLTSGNLQTIQTQQLAMAQSIANNLDGSCGRKIHEAIMKDISEK